MQGFTLIEMLVVFGVFALIGVISSQIVSRVIANQQTMQERGQRFTEVQRAMQILQRDILQLTNRPVRDELGDPLEPMVIGADGLIEFTRLGWRNPLAQHRAEEQRVAYVLQDDKLRRAYWNVLDRTPATEPVLQDLLEGVENVEFLALDLSGNTHSFWPVASGIASPDTQLVGIVVRMEIQPFGTVERIWTVPSLGPLGPPDIGLGPGNDE
jgi:general secretion pathway protein J